MSINVDQQAIQTRKDILKDFRQNNITKVVAEYGGYHDSGNVEAMNYVNGSGETLVLPSADQRVADFIWNFVQTVHEGCEVDAGAEGIFTWEIDSDKISIQHEQRHVSTESYKHSDL